MNIVIAGHFEYPTGSAAASRIRHFARGLTECGHRVHVISMTLAQSGDSAEVSHDGWCMHDTVPYAHAGGVRTAHLRRSAVRKACARLSSWRRALHEAKARIAGLDRTTGVDVLIGYSNMGFGFHGLMPFCRRRQIPVVRDVVEWLGPESFHGGAKNPLYWNAQLSFRWTVPKSDGVIGISKFIVENFSKLGLPTLRVPAIIDPAAFEHLAPPPPGDADRPFQLSYLGNMNHRDGPFLMIEAIRQLLAEGHDVLFNIIGNTDPIPAARQARMRVEADALLRERVIFRGRVSDDEVKHRLFTSDALIFTRTSGRASRAAFPTRLPEYLVSGRPVISSNVSDIGEYLRDGKEIVLVKPDSAEALAEGIRRLLQMPDRGRSLGLAGKRRCGEVFHYASRSAQISAFLEALVQRPAAKSLT